MNLEEYKAAGKELERQFEIKKSNLMKAFVDSNNPFKLREIITDHIGSIKIESMSYAWDMGIPCVIYTGVMINKDGRENKQGKVRDVWQSNVKK